MSDTPGRNDPCYCGSGKKYKNCHLSSDEQARLNERPSLPAEDPQATFDFGDLAGMVSLVENRAELEAALAKLKPYEEEFASLIEDEVRFMERVELLFSEEAFNHLHFTADDLTKAFKAVGVPSPDADSEDTVALYGRALDLLCTADRRTRFMVELLLLVPRYADAGRYLDARLTAFIAQVIGDLPARGNPFLVQMFHFGVERWVEQQKVEKLHFLEELGYKPTGETTVDDIEEWLREISADPVKAARLEELMQSNPDVLPAADNDVVSVAETLRGLLDREEAAHLLPSGEEFDAFVPLFTSEMQKVAARFQGRDDSAIPGTEKEVAFEEIILPMLRKVTTALYTPAKIRQLVADLRAYRKILVASGDRQSAQALLDAISLVEDEDDPGQNPLLLDLCVVSMERACAAE